MFVCESSTGRHVSKSGQPCVRVVVERRDRVYPERYYSNRDNTVTYHDAGGQGWEVVREENRCPEHLGE